ncbi:DEAD/DEAH box helicase family protein [Nonomuraea aurantiaca]|uniref:DEAD/DEAH box helicase family protein n=1 Tax=Nonomuraea aurantiaca TaxID=2878562 RepID=UPI001CDA1E8C|nr:DEAD/DEAH box helicase family protein [Nonomuraea aurantiaca]MCA2227554.1 DEAD/DEAH box helicase family protein [Nonomuraea aurantiaca]
MGNFAFLQSEPEWADLYDGATRAERLAVADPRVSCFYARRTLELAVTWLYKADETLKLPYRDDLSALITEPTMVKLVGPAIRTKMDLIRRQGNTAVHKHGPVATADSVRIVGELFHVMYWIARQYARNQDALPAAGLAFDQALIPKPVPADVRQKKQAEIQAMAEEFGKQQAELAKERRKSQDLDAELAQLRAEIKAAKAVNAKVPDTHDYNEAETRDLLIDLLLHEAGWPLDKPEDREFPVTGMPTPSGKGKVDYVLWDDNGKPLGLVEAKRTTSDATAGQHQAKAYAGCLEQKYGQRPVIFYTNGYETYIWDDLNYPPRKILGFYTKDELRTLIHRPSSRRPLGTETVNEEIAGRHYQSRAIRRIDDAFEKDHLRQALLVMATGSGKTRTVIALVDQLIRAGWVKRVLFLADRQALVTQATNAFKQHLPGVPTVNLLNDKNTDGRVYVSTYPTMMGLINETSNGLRRFGPGYFDLVVIDEAHRSVYQKYGMLFDYFDSLLVGLTATPREEIDRNTYRLFNLEDGVPTDVYGLDEAVSEGYLVAPRGVDVPLKFLRKGIKYDDLSEEEKEAWDAADWDENDDVPSEISADELNKFLFNKDTIDKTLETLMTYGAKVEGGDRLGKTIIFARNNNHAEFIVQRFDTLFPEYRGEFAQVITHKKVLAQDLIDKFSDKNKAPHIAISVDMLDTGIDIPEVVNLVFAKMVRSKTKFWQMIGRGTRICPDLFGPNQDKSGFLVFDLCQNFEFFNQDLAPAEGRLQPSLSERLFKHRMDLLLNLDQQNLNLTPPAEKTHAETKTVADLRWSLAERLQIEVANMNPANVEVRRHLREVETYRESAHWQKITLEKHTEITQALASLPTEFREDENSQEAKRFDLLALRLQLAQVEADASYLRLCTQVQEIASALLDPTTLTIPAVRQQQELLEDLTTDSWWEDVTLPMLESMRRRLRGLAKLIPKVKRGIVYTDFQDELGELGMTEIKGVVLGTDKSRFESKVRTYLRSHENELAVQKLRRNQQITTVDLEELEQIFIVNGFGTEADIEQAKTEHDGLGVFLRSLTGLDREAASRAFDQFQAGQNLTASQLHFLRLLIDYLAKNGIMEVEALYESPFTALAPRGPEDLFSEASVDAIVLVLQGVRATATPEEHAA